MEFNKFTWSLYKDSDIGKVAISEFEKAAELANEIELSFKYNHQMGISFGGDKEKDSIAMILNDYWNYVISFLAPPQSEDEARSMFEQVIDGGLEIEGEIVVPKGDYQFSLGCITWLSWLLYELAPSYFFPNLFQYQIRNLYQIVDCFDIELPEIPRKSDYRARCMFYWELCRIFNAFRLRNELSSQELCAFLYDYAPNFIHKGDTEIPQPSQVWFIGGKINEIDHADGDLVFWQGNQETRKGDIMVHYETSPVSAITHIWTAATDGLIDPFFHYYGNVYLTSGVEVPHIGLDELKRDNYFSSHPLVRKNFQGVNGWPIRGEDYSRLCEMLEAKGFNTELLPKLFAPKVDLNMNLKLEEDVEIKLLEPMLDSMGFIKNKDYVRRLPVKAGRGHRIIPDYALHYDSKHDEERAKVLIEAKYHMKNPQEVEAAFKQARSYARLLDSTVLILCDKDCVLVYQQNPSFDRSKYQKFYWGELSSPDRFIALKKLLM